MIRHFYNDPLTQEKYEYSLEDIQNGAVRDGLAVMTAKEIDEHLNPAPVPLSRDQIDMLRLLAFADPVTGSDRYFVEALSSSDPDKADKAKALGNARRAEIQAMYPWPDDGAL